MVKAVETFYKGYRFRSRLEARWAIFFDAMGIAYEYEPEGVTVNGGKYYLPDFYLPEFHCYFEVKHAPKKIMRSLLPHEEFDEEIQKISYGAFTGAWAGIIAFGDPYDHYMWIFCQEINDSSGGSYDGPVVFGKTKDGEPILYAWDDLRDRTFLNSFESSHAIPMETNCDYPIGTNPFLNDFVLSAELKARQARFEHGESPTIF